MVTVGENFSHYEIIAPIGAGGMGEVYLAKDHNLERNVALKFVTSKPGQDTERAKRFIREAKAASALNHPNILTIYEVGETNGTRYIASEYIDGTSLRDLIRGGGLTLNETLDIAMQTLSAIATAHSAGIVHRDIKPENIMLRKDGVVKVLDFGLAKLIEPEAETRTSSESVTKALITTSQGMVLGTAQYMSPEQARAKRVDARSDIWSLGVVLYEMLAGVAPFEGESVSDVFAAILKTEPKPISSYRPELPPELEFIIKKALGKDPEDRYQAVKDFLLDLKLVKREFESGATSAEHEPATGQSIRLTNAATELRVTEAIVAASRWKWIAAAGVAMAVLSGAGYLWVASETPTGFPTALASSQIASWKSELTDSDSSPARLSPDGKFVAYIASKDGKRTIWLKQIGGGDPFTRKQDPDSEESSPLWSPDSGQTAFISERNGARGIWMMPAFGGAQTLLAPIETRGQAALIHWSKDGSKIFFDMKQNLYSLDLATKQITKLTNFDEAVFIARGYSFSPDEKQVAFADRRDGRKDIWISRPDGENATRLVDDAASDSNPIWHPDGKRVIYNSERDGLQQIFVAHVDRRTPVQLTISDSDSTVFDISSDGTKLLYATAKDDSDIWAVPVDGGKESQKTSGVGVEFWPEVSHADGQIVFQSVRQPSIGNRLLQSSLEVIKPDGRQTVISDNGFEPRFSPDGSLIAFLRGNAGNNSLWVTSTRGGDARQLGTSGGVVFGGNTKLPFNRVQMQDYQWAPDGRSIVYCAIRDGFSNVWRVNLDGEETPLTNNQSKSLIFLSPMLSRDGEQAVWMGRSSSEPAKREWSIWHAAAGNQRQVYRSEAELGLVGWSDSEKEFFVRTVDSSVASLAKPIDVRLLEINLTDGRSREIKVLKSTYFQNIIPAPDRRAFAFVSRSTDGDILEITAIAANAPRVLVSSNDPRVYFAGLSFAPDGKTVYYAKQANWRILSMINNFK